MNGIPLGAVQAILASTGGARLAPRLQSINKELSDCPVARELMASQKSQLGSFLRLIRDAAEGNLQTAKSPSDDLPTVELRSELETIDDASLEDLVAILVSIGDLLREATRPTPSAPSNLATQAAGEYGDWRGAGSPPQGPSISDDPSPADAPRWTPDAPPVNYSIFNDENSVSTLMEMLKRLRGSLGDNGGIPIPTPPDQVIDPIGKTPPQPTVSPMFLTDTDARRVLLGSTDTLQVASPRPVAGQAAQRPAVPDLVYIPVVSPAQEGAARGERPAVRSFQLVSLPRVAQADPVQALQSIVARIEEAVRQRRTGEGYEPAIAPEMEHFFQSRLAPEAPAPEVFDTSLVALARARGASSDHSQMAVEAVRQAQAAVADMVDRQMSGDVRFDSERMRAVMHLEPPALGRLHIDLQVQDGQRVVVHVDADQQDTRDFLRDNQSDLRQGLAQQGFDPDQVEIRFDEDQAAAFRRLFAASAPRV